MALLTRICSTWYSWPQRAAVARHTVPSASAPDPNISPSSCQCVNQHHTSCKTGLLKYRLSHGANTLIRFELLRRGTLAPARHKIPLIDFSARLACAMISLDIFRHCHGGGVSLLAFLRSSMPKEARPAGYQCQSTTTTIHTGRRRWLTRHQDWRVEHQLVPVVTFQ